MSRLKIPLLLLFFAVLWAASAPVCQARGYTYITTQRTVNAGIINISNSNVPYIFYVFNQRSDIKPFGWNVVNPISNGASPNSSAYWNVDLANDTVSQLLQYNVLFLQVLSVAAITPDENEKLRRFVDAGGVLWLDGHGHSGNLGTTNLFLSLTFGAGGMNLAFPVYGGSPARHPLLSTPYLLSAAELDSLEPFPTGYTFTATSNDLLVNVLNYSSGQALAAGQLGAGYVVVTGLDVTDTVNTPAGLGATATPGDFLSVPVGDLKFMANLIALSGTHPTGQKNSHQNAASDDALSSSIAPAWNWANSGSASGAAIYGNFVYITTSDGVLHAFDAYPAEALLGGAPDDGIADFNAVPPTSYDEIWNVSVGTGASAPTVGSYSGESIVFVEKGNGSVVGYDATTGGAAKYTLTPSAVSAFSAAAPAPTYYSGRIYAGQSDGTVFVYDLHSAASAGSGVKVPVTIATVALGTPAITLLPDPNSGTTRTNDIVALVPASDGMYSLFLGSRGELLTTLPGQGFSTKLLSMGFNSNIRVDPNTAPLPNVYDVFGNVIAATPSTSPNFVFTTAAAGQIAYGDYDVTFNSGPTDTLTRSTIGINSVSTVNATGTVSTPAIDRNGYAYYTAATAGSGGTDSSLFCVQDAPQFGSVKIRWRFRLPFGNEPVTDADGVSYVALEGFQFVGSPIVDSSGFVYAIAQKGSSATVLCFNTAQAVYADITDGATASADADSIVSQPLLNGATSGVDEFGNPANPLSNGSQYYHSGSTVTFTNFGLSQSRTLSPNICEPEPVLVLPPPVLNGQTATQPPPFSAPLHTNLAWQATIPPPPTSLPVPSASFSGLSKDGDTLFMTATYSSGADRSMLYKIDVNTHAVTHIPIGGANGIGTVSAAPSAANGIVIATGAAGVAALTRQTALVADNNRILETDLSGAMLWAVDSTTSTNPQGASTQVEFKHPTYLSEVSTDDYLVADTGNNRCVRFNRAGQVLWELTRFEDPNTLLAAGETMTLNQPTSVVVQRTGAAGVINIKYLIADSGNSRIIEVTDSYTASGVLIGKLHTLTWVSHTFDKQNRLYHYSSADYYTDTAKTYIFAVVSNTRIAQLPGATTPGPTSGDTPGGSIALLNYGGASDGLLYAVVNSFVVGPKTYQITNPRFLQVYTPPNTLGATALKSLLFADDNGAFDLSFSGSTLSAGSTTPLPVVPALHFLKSDYQGMGLLINTGKLPLRSSLSFQPSCIQRIGNDANGLPTYLITQTYGQSELGDGDNKIGGEIFSVTGSSPVVANTATGGFGGSGSETLSRPVTTGPLTQPTFAIRL